MNNSLDQSLGDVKDGGADACYLTFFNNHLITAGYGKGRIGVYPLDTAGRIMPACQIVDFSSEGGVSRLHMARVLTAPQTGNNYLLVTDKGCDRVYSLRITEEENGLRLSRCDSAYISVPKGYGPRHMGHPSCSCGQSTMGHTLGGSPAFLLLQATFPAVTP